MAARILVVDDDQDTLKLLRLILESSGLVPILTENGRQAVLAIAAQRPDLVLCDVLMPEMDGGMRPWKPFALTRLPKPCPS